MSNDEVQTDFLQNTTSELAYGLHSAKVATRELACAVDWEASQGRCSKVRKINDIYKYIVKI